MYAHLLKLVEDSHSLTDVLLLLKLSEEYHKVWMSEKLYIVSETRSSLIAQLEVAWRSDHVFRLGRIKMLPHEQKPLRKKAFESGLQVPPVKGYRVEICQGYSFFVPESYTFDVGHVMQSASCRMLKCKERGWELTLHVLPKVHLDVLESENLDHIRWAAVFQKQHASRDLTHTCVVRYGIYMKKMNLTNDLACWTAWELFLKSETQVVMQVLLRRQYLPPMMDMSQDILVSIMCPIPGITKGSVSDEDLRFEAHRMADSVAPRVHNCTVYPTVYREMVQAKLDVLLFNEDALKWLGSSLNLKPAHERKAKHFVHSILRMLHDENVLADPSLMKRLDDEQYGATSEPMVAAAALMGEMSAHKHAQSFHAWCQRVARYLAFCVDGGLFPKQLSLYELVNPYFVNRNGRRKAFNVIHYLLHIRPKDLEKPYTDMGPEQLAQLIGLGSYTFNDRVMQSLIELGWIAKCLASSDTDSAWSRGNVQLAPAYCEFLAQLLFTNNTSINTKMAICRQIIASGTMGDTSWKPLLPALVELLRGAHGAHLETYATVAIVNVVGGDDVAKGVLFALGIAPMCASNLQSKDDDLLLYTLVLLTSLTKSLQHRQIVNKCGVDDTLIDLLKVCYANPYKTKVLAELASVIGQLCNDEPIRQKMALPDGDELPPAARCFLHILVGRRPDPGRSPDDRNRLRATGNKSRSKAMFALKQLAVGDKFIRDRVGKEAIPTVVEYFFDVVKLDEENSWREECDREPIDLDCGFNAVVFMALMSISHDNCMLMYNSEFYLCLPKVRMTRLGEVDTVVTRIRQMEARIINAAHAERSAVDSK